MTIERTKELLGDKVKSLSDEEINTLINRTEKLLDTFMSRFVVDSSTVKISKPELK